jgi:hypothetical protein
MPGFVSFDPPIIANPPTSIGLLPYHEAAHLFFAYHYGFEIGGFRFFRSNGDTWAKVFNRPGKAHAGSNAQVLACKEARKLLAGEIAARIKAELPTDRIVLVLNAPQPESLTAQTPFSAIYPTADQRHDAVRVLGLFRHNYDLPALPENWWNWIWTCHKEAEAILRANWQLIERLVSRIKTIRRFDTWSDWWTGQRPLGQTDGATLIGWCKKLQLPLDDPTIISEPYTPADAYAD